MPNRILNSPRLSRRSRSAIQSGWLASPRNGLRVLEVRAFKRLPWLVHGFSTRPGGESLLDGQRVTNLGFTEWDAREHVLANRKRFFAAVGAAEWPLLSLRQLHSDAIHVVDAVPTQPCPGDALATRAPGLLLSILTADCVPILLADTKRRVVAAVHAGWRGTLQRIVSKAVGRLRMSFGTRPADLVAALGPAIGGCCYEVGAEVACEFASQFAQAADWFDELRTGDEPNPLQWLSMAPPGHQPPPKNVLLDLRAANRSQLLDAGLAEINIFSSDLCTACRSDLFFSYRKESAQSGRLMAVVGVRG